MNKYTSKETAQKVGLSYCVFLQKVRAGEFPCHKFSRRKIFFTDEDIEAIIKGAEVSARPKENRG